ncbi:DUF4430 domain-containing protein [Sporosarcina obsidiansis]|uniref:DUF4430 domain-containing protein n=1 Tax=Sporosarcina obsidiansis TaxID=2660748 RepID=UPI00129A248D|nr:DUF4430 domain-containing protein [Sporosarcina obsidiansis]
MKQLQKFTGFLLILTLAFLLTACGSSLQKPTGLEDQDIENVPTIEEQPNEPIDEELSGDLKEDNKGNPEQQATNDGESTTDDKVDTAKTETAPVAKPKPAQPEVTKPREEKPTTPSEKQPTKVEKPAPKPTEKPVAKPTEKPASKPTEKPAVKPDPKPTPPAVEKPAAPAKSKIVYSIVISPSEVPLPPTEMEIQDGDTVLAALIEITKKHKVQMDYRGGQGATAYVEGMANVYEFDRGQGSGWMYRVNGIFPDRGAGVVPLMDGDQVEWLYTTNLGVDLNANLKPFRR